MGVVITEDRNASILRDNNSQGSIYCGNGPGHRPVSIPIGSEMFNPFLGQFLHGSNNTCAKS